MPQAMQPPASADTAVEMPGSPQDRLDDILGEDTDSSGSGDGDAINQILGDEDDEEEEQPSESAETDEDEEGAEPEPGTDTATDRAKRRAELAKQYGLDPNSPANAAALRALLAQEKRLGDKDGLIRKYEAELTPFERELIKQAQARQAPPARAATGQPAGQPQPVQQQSRPGQQDSAPYFGDGFDALSVDDILQREIEAYTATRPDGSKDWKQVNEVQTALLQRRFAQHIAPRIEQYVQSQIEQRLEQRLKNFAEKDLGDVLPEVRRSVQERAIGEARDFAMSELMKSEDFSKDWKELLKVAEGAKPLPGGYANNAFNQILRDFPEILEIRVQHEDPRTAEILTVMKQARTVRKMFQGRNKQAAIAPAMAKKLTQTGAAIADKKIRDRARQSVNAGSTANRGSSGSDDTDDLFSGSAGTIGIPASRLFGKR